MLSLLSNELLEQILLCLPLQDLLMLLNACDGDQVLYNNILCLKEVWKNVDVEKWGLESLYTV